MKYVYNKIDPQPKRRVVYLLAFLFGLGLGLILGGYLVTRDFMWTSVSDYSFQESNFDWRDQMKDLQPNEVPVGDNGIVQQAPVESVEPSSDVQTSNDVQSAEETPPAPKPRYINNVPRPTTSTTGQTEVEQQ